MKKPESKLITDESGARFWETADGDRWQYPDFAVQCASMACNALGFNLPAFDSYLDRRNLNLFEAVMLHEWRSNLVAAFTEGQQREVRAWAMLMRTHLTLGAQNRKLSEEIWRSKEGSARGGTAGRRLPEYPMLLQAFEQALAHQQTDGQRTNKAAAYTALGNRFNASVGAVRQALRRGKLRTPP